jgi:hypothetical protein
MHRSLKQEGARRGTLAGTGGQKEGMFGESPEPVDNVPSDAVIFLTICAFLLQSEEQIDDGCA